MQKVFQIIRANQRAFGGAEIYLERLVAELEKMDVSYEVINSKVPKWIASGLRALLFDWQVCFTKTPHSFYYSLDRVSCADILRVGDGVHKHYMSIKKSFPLLPLNLVYTYIEKRAFKNAKHLIAISEMVKRNMMDCYGVPADKISVIYNGITPKEYDKALSKKRLQQEFPINDEPILLYVGSGYKRKGVFELLRLFALLKHQDAKLFIVGKEKHMKAYKMLAKSLKIHERVFFAGARKDVDDFYAIADLFIFPTHYEPFGNVILEAMNAKCAVITTKQCGGGEIIESEYLMDHPCDFRIVPIIDALLQDSMRLTAVQTWNHTRSLEFSMNKNADETLEVIKRFLLNDATS